MFQLCGEPEAAVRFKRKISENAGEPVSRFILVLVRRCQFGELAKASESPDRLGAQIEQFFLSTSGKEAAIGGRKRLNAMEKEIGKHLVTQASG
jgi:hypothetical protein